MARRQPTSYAWAFHARTLGLVGKLSGDAWEGLEFAEKLAEAAAFRAERALAHDEPLPQPLTIEEIADQHSLTPSSVRRRIALAREQIFGGLSDAGIRYRVRERRRRLNQETRACAEPGCPSRIPRTAPRHRRYCVEHSTPAARVRRHRTATRETPTL